MWWSIGTTLSGQRSSAMDAGARDTTNLSRAFADNIERIVSGADHVLLSLRAAYKREGPDFDLKGWAQRETPSDRLIEQVAIIGSDGVSIASSTSSQRVNLADRRHFTAQRAAVADKLYISAPVLGRTSGRWTIQLTRRIQGADGSFQGVVVVSIDCIQLSHFFESLNLQNGFIELSGLDGIVRARGPSEPRRIGDKVAFDPEAVAGHEEGSFRLPDGRDTLTVAYRHLAAYPLVVLVGFTDEAVLSGFRKTQRALLWSGGIATLIVTIIGGVWIAQRKRSIRFQRSLELTLESMSQGLVMVDADNHVRVVNRRALDLLGLPLSLLSSFGAKLNRRRSTAEARLIARLSQCAIARDREDGTVQPVLEFSASPTPAGGSVQIITDVTARDAADRRIRHMALHDHLTGLGNRVLFADQADHLLSAAVAAGDCLDLLCLDLNGFKKINDTLGHDFGDRLLVEVADRLQLTVGEGGLLARTGGDEFNVLTRVDRPEPDRHAVATAIAAALERPFSILGQQIRIGVSIGIARCPDDGDQRVDLLRSADLAMYAAKADRQHPIRRYEPAMAEGARLKQRLEEDLRAAIGTDQFFLEFQPQFRTSNLAVVGFEALVRWNHPVRGRLNPDDFIPIAEETGLIVALGHYVLELACRVALHWPDEVHIAVNLSPVQFRDPQIIQTVASILEATGLPAARLELEVTEGVLIADEYQALQTLGALRELGVTLALDDFGTGYASLSYLRKYPFEQIKLDRSFVQAQVLEERSRHILQAVLSLSRNLRLSVVAEGVETRTQLHLLRKQGCHAVQGFLVGRPMSRRDVEGMFPSGDRVRPPFIAAPG